MANYKIVWYADIVDINGDTARLSFSKQTVDTDMVSDLQTLSAAFVTAIGASTNGKVIRTGATITFDEAQLIVGTSPPNAAEYSKVEEGARLQFSNANGSRASITLPAPVTAVFNASPAQNTVNPGGSAANLITFMKANATDQGGNLLNLYQGGVKTGKHARKRPNRRA